jgi:hypothetical protein
LILGYLFGIDRVELHDAAFVRSFLWLLIHESRSRYRVMTTTLVGNLDDDLRFGDVFVVYVGR